MLIQCELYNNLDIVWDSFTRGRVDTAAELREGGGGAADDGAGAVEDLAAKSCIRIASEGS